MIVEFENAETLLISEVQMLLEHRYDVTNGVKLLLSVA